MKVRHWSRALSGTERATIAPLQSDMRGIVFRTRMRRELREKHATSAARSNTSCAAPSYTTCKPICATRAGFPRLSTIPCWLAASTSRRTSGARAAPTSARVKPQNQRGSAWSGKNLKRTCSCDSVKRRYVSSAIVVFECVVLHVSY